MEIQISEGDQTGVKRFEGSWTLEIWKIKRRKDNRLN